MDIQGLSVIDSGMKVGLQISTNETCILCGPSRVTQSGAHRLGVVAIVSIVRNDSRGGVGAKMLLSPLRLKSFATSLDR